MQTDTLIIGCGIAGAAAALRLSENPQHRIIVLTRAANPDDSNTRYAQGGIVVRGIGDSPELLVKDILYAGAGLSSPKAAYILASEGPGLVQSLLVDRCGVQFDTSEEGQPIYGLEAAHSVRRIVHVSDKTGEAIARHLLLAMQERPNITLLTDFTAIDLLRKGNACIGATVLNNVSGGIETIVAAQTILATGGLGQIYRHTTNPAGARGDGIAMAHRIGADIANLEFVQFHPTALYTPGVMKPLVSEAVRGEGAILLNQNGERFMMKYAPEQLELAPRDVVAHAIHTEMAETQQPYMLLDIASQHSPEFIREHFPALVENAALMGIDATHNPVSVVPAAHYSCGGVRVDEWGRTTVPGLFAIGEVSCTGLHGANRLASTSLLEGLVWGDRAARYVALSPRKIQPANVPNVSSKSQANASIAPAQITDAWQQLRQIMWENVGIVRTETLLQDAETQLRHLCQTVENEFNAAVPTDALVGLRNAVQTGYLVAAAARKNRQSRGAHYRADSLDMMEQKSDERIRVS
jgi:L-aspartate oxidase